MKPSSSMLRGIALLALVAVLAPFAAGQATMRTDSTSTHLVLNGNPIKDLAPSSGGYYYETNEVDFQEADIDLDGDLDVLVGLKGSYTPNMHGVPNRILINDGTGILTDMTATYSNWGSKFDNTRDVEAVDLDGDTFPEAIIYNAFGENTDIYRNLGNDAFGNWQGFSANPISTIPSPPQVGTTWDESVCEGRTFDFDLDGDLDIIRANYKNGAPDDFFIHGPNLTWTDGTSLLPGSFWDSSFGAVIQTEDLFDGGILDLNKDGFVDVLMIGSSEVKVAYTDGMGGFLIGVDGMAQSATYAGVAADFDRDGRADIFRTNDGNDFWRRNTGTASNGAIIESQTDGSTYANRVGGNTDVCDFNNDGLPDLFINHVDVDLPGFLANEPLYLYINTGNPNAMFQEDTVMNYPINTFDTAVADFDGDGIEDMLTAAIGTPNTPGDARFFYYLSDPTGSSQGFNVRLTPEGNTPNLYDYWVRNIPQGSAGGRTLYNLFSGDMSGNLGDGPILGLGTDVMIQFSLGFPFNNPLPNSQTDYYLPIGTPQTFAVRYRSVMVDFASGYWEMTPLRELVVN